MAKRFVPPPNWPALPPGWQPPEGWRPDPRWGPAPYGWQFWQEEPERSWFARHKVVTALVAAPMVLVVGLFGLGAWGTATSDPATFTNSTAGQTVAPSPTASAPPTPSQLSADSPGSSASARAEANAKAAAVTAAKQKAAAEKAAKVKAAKARAAKAKAAKAAKVKAAKAAKVKAAKAKAAKAKAAKAKAAEAKQEAEDCTTGYSPCLPWASDYDCAGGSGNGPEYVHGSVRVTGSDPYDLDRNGDGIGCES